MISAQNHLQRLSGSRVIIYLLSKDKTPFKGVCNLPQIKTLYHHTSIDLNPFDLLIFTSKESIKALQKSGIDLKGVSALCISKKTAYYAKKFQMKVLESANGYGKELFEMIQARYKEKKIFFPHAKVLAYDLIAKMQNEGIDFEHQCVYETVCEKKQEIRFKKDDIFIFTSPSTVHCFKQNYGFWSGLRAVVIGETTKDAMPKEAEVFVSKKTTIESCIEKARSL